MYVFKIKRLNFTVVGQTHKSEHQSLVSLFAAGLTIHRGGRFGAIGCVWTWKFVRRSLFSSYQTGGFKWVLMGVGLE